MRNTSLSRSHAGVAVGADMMQNPKSTRKTVHHWWPPLMHLGCMTYIYIYIYIYILATVVEGDPKALFQNSTIPRCRGMAQLLSSGFPLFTYVYFLMTSTKQGGIKYRLLSHCQLDLGFNPGHPCHWKKLYPQCKLAVKLVDRSKLCTT